MSVWPRLASCNNLIVYTGKRQDTVTGLVYMGPRYYAHRPGRFLSVDLGESNLNNLNRYALANNNPYNFIDWD